MICIEKQGAVDVVKPRTAIDAANAPALKQAVLRSTGSGRPMVVIDMHDVPLVDSAGMETLLDLRDHLESRGGAVKLAGTNPLCSDVLRVTGVGEKLEQYAQVRSAVGSFAE
jgi:anti-sigma B factor antagonist